MISKKYNDISKREFYTKFFQFYNIVIEDKHKKLNSREIELLSEFLDLDQNKYKITRFSTAGKEQVISNVKGRTGEEIELTTINTHLTSLKKKGLILTQSDRVSYLNSNLIKVIEIANSGKPVDFKFNFNIK
jgi:predicted transcriptional regulator